MFEGWGHERVEEEKIKFVTLNSGQPTRDTPCPVLVAAVSLDPGADECLSDRLEVLIHIATLRGKDKETRAQKAAPRKGCGMRWAVFELWPSYD